jgi:hypothetical protein
MPYSNFSIKKVEQDFQIKIVENSGIFSNIPSHEISSFLQETLTENVPLATAINTEKARSELIIAPVLIEIRKLFNRQISLFSGIELNVDKEKDLTGFCDFLISRSSEQLFLKSPIIALVEAKNENIMSGLGQCAAEMIASKIYNEKEGNIISKIYGVITSGNLWKFLRLEDNTLYVDLDDYVIKDITKIVGILYSMIEISNSNDS